MTGLPLLTLVAGSFAMESLDIADAGGDFEVLGFVNSLEPPAPGAQVEGRPVFWFEALPFGPEACRLAAGIVSTRRRAFVETMAQRGYQFVSVVHPSAVISRRAQLVREEFALDKMGREYDAVLREFAARADDAPVP